MIAFSLAIFAGAFLLFQIQPLIARFLLPWFGGGSAVWTTCLLFFQIALLAGYAYAHATVRYLSPRTQAVLHLVLLAGALAFLPIVPGTHWKPGPAEDPTWRLLALLGACIGAPFFVLSSTAPLLQAWFTRLRPGAVPYRLYALSNAGSLLALVSYPFLFEPTLTRRAQASLWAWGFGFFVLLCGSCAWRVWRSKATNRPGPSPTGPAPTECPPTPFARSLWLLLPMCGSALLLGTTNKLCQDVAIVPFLWVLPLSLYILTFILCFERSAWYRRTTFTLLLIPALALLCYALFRWDQPLLPQVLIYGGSLFVCCMVCHGEAYRLKPAPQHLTGFYLMIAAGGALGGVFVAVVAPQVFRWYAELNWSLCLLGVLVTLIHLREKTGWTIKGWRWPAWPLMAVGTVALSAILVIQGQRIARAVVAMSRNFYGALRVGEFGKGDPAEHGFELFHGTIRHGAQFADPVKARRPTTYFGELSGVGLAMKYLPRQTNRRIGIVGLGVGTLAVYGKPGDTFRFYELNPEVHRLARKWFTYLRNCEARVEVVIGDGRLTLESEPAQNFDLLVLDAFSGDAPPVHLLTWEAFETYRRHLKADGVIAVNITNVQIDFLPVMLGVADYFQLGMIWVPQFTDTQSMAQFIVPSQWVLLSGNLGFLSSEPILSHSRAITSRNTVKWTDDYTSLLPLLAW